MNELELTGRARTHIVELEVPRCAVHYEVAASFLAMRDAAARDGIDLVARSGFRDFSAQLGIWNRKWTGEKAVLDRRGQPIDRAHASEQDLMDAILCWSAIPGGSRHHWGSDLDLIDAAARLPAGYEVQLTPDEYAPTGVFGRLNQWLNTHMHEFGFFRPYRTDKGGVHPEPWHVSYAPVSVDALESLSLSLLRQVLEASHLQGKPQVMARLPEIYTRFLLAIDLPASPTAPRVEQKFA